jgi:hypothetical protein
VTSNELEKHLYDLVSMYFASAKVIWGSAGAVKPHIPVVTLHTGTLQRHYQPLTQNVNGVPVNCYELTTTLQVDLYTRGGAIATTAPKQTTAYENTATNDLEAFTLFLDSAFVSDWCEDKDITLIAGNVQDLTAIINDTTWNYRAMVEIEVRFTQIAVGAAGVLSESSIKYPGDPQYPQPPDEPDPENPSNPEIPPDPENPQPPPSEYPPKGDVPVVVPEWNEPTSSGGGSQQLADETVGYFERVELEDSK